MNRNESKLRRCDLAKHFPSSHSDRSIRLVVQRARISLASTALASWLIAGAPSAEPATPAPTEDIVSQVMAWSHVPRESVVSTKSDIAVALLRRAPASDASSAAVGVELEGEVVDEPTARALGYRSLRVVADVDCDESRDRVRALEVFGDHGLHGSSKPLDAPDAWSMPTERAYMHDVISAVCSGRPNRADVLSKLARAVLAKPRAEAAVAAFAPPPTPALPPEATASSPAGGLSNETVQSDSRPQTAFVAQLAALPSEDAARARLSEVELPPGLATAIDKVQAGGKVVYRALVTGFADETQALAFCAGERARQRDCWAHPARGER